MQPAHTRPRQHTESSSANRIALRKRAHRSQTPIVAWNTRVHRHSKHKVRFLEVLQFMTVLLLQRPNHLVHINPVLHRVPLIQQGNSNEQQSIRSVSVSSAHSIHLFRRKEQKTRATSAYAEMQVAQVTIIHTHMHHATRDTFVRHTRCWSPFSPAHTGAIISRRSTCGSSPPTRSYSPPLFERRRLPSLRTLRLHSTTPPIPTMNNSTSNDRSSIPNPLPFRCASMERVKWYLVRYVSTRSLRCDADGRSHALTAHPAISRAATISSAFQNTNVRRQIKLQMRSQFFTNKKTHMGLAGGMGRPGTS